MQGNITKALKAGFPPSLLIGIAPPTAPIDRFPEPGKVPAYWHSTYGWTRRKDWENGVGNNELVAVNEHDGNVGLRLGCVSSGKQFVALDLDTESDNDPNSEQSRLAHDIFLQVTKLIPALLGVSTVWVRKTRPDRATILIALDAKAEPGSIETTHFSHPSGINAGKIQVLASGQQTVIGGVHSWNGGTPIVWQSLYDGEIVFEESSYPTVSEIPELPDRFSVNNLIADICFQLEVALSLSYTTRKIHSSIFHNSGTPLTLDQQAAWGPETFKQLMAELPHDERTNREQWVTLMLAAAGAIKAAKALGKIDAIEEAEMCYAAVDWSARWEGPDGQTTDIETEQEVWERDFYAREVNIVGWQQLINCAISLGCHDWNIEKAHHDFPDDTFKKDHEPLPELPLDTTLYQEPIGPNPFTSGIETERKSKKLRFDTKTSEIQIADFVEERLAGKCAWIQEEKRWIMWGGPEIGWANPKGDAAVQSEIQNQLIYYSVQNENFNESTCASLTSERMVSAINRLLRARLTVTTSELDKGELVVQTPKGAWDLVSGRPFTVGELKRQADYRDRRMAGCAPKEGDTPIFNDLLDHLACGDKDVIDYLWSYFGYALLGQPKLHNILIVYGPGGNGKSTVANVLSRIFGDYAVTLDRRVLVQSGSSDHPTGLKRADKKRLWCVAEINPKEQWNESLVRTMSGGDLVPARAMNQNMSEFRPEGTFLIYTQFVPALHRVDEAILRRFRMLHARIKVPDELIDRNMENKIIDREGPAILARLIKEAAAIVSRDWSLPRVPASMQIEVKKYFAGQDTFALWFSEECVSVRSRGPDTDIAIESLYERYKRHVKSNGLNAEDDDFMGDNVGADIMSMPAFTGALRRAGVLLNDELGRSIKGPAGKQMARGIQLKNGVIGLVA